MNQYKVTGMSCAACQARVEKAVSRVNGVSSCSVSLLTNSLGVEGDAAPEAVIRAVRAAGYDASLVGESSGSGSDQVSNSMTRPEMPGEYQKETIRHLKKRLIASLVFLLILMYLTMGHMMLGLPLPAFLHGNPTGIGVLQLLLD